MTMTSMHDFEFLLASLVEQVPGAREAVVVSSDGLLLSSSPQVERADADRLAAVASALLSIARGAGEPMRAGAVHEIIIEMERALLLVMGISDGSALAVVAVRPCDIGLVAYEMATFVERVGAVLTPTISSVQEVRGAP